MVIELSEENRVCVMETRSALEILSRNVEIIEPKGELAAKLEKSAKTGKPLRVKLGFDPTAPDLHLGHAVVLRKLRDFQDLGHTVIALIGDYTARIGDPTGRNEARPPLSPEKIKENAQTYLDQLGKILDLSKVEIRSNSEWFGGQDFAGALVLSAQFTLAQILQRKDFRTRYDEGRPVHMHEIMYPMMQGQDSVELSADVEIGGTDQVFNCLFGRDLQKTKDLDAQVVMCMPLIVGTDGVDKMSKSKGNYIALTEDPENMYGKLMSVPEELLPLYIRLLTNFPVEEQEAMIEGLSAEGANPMDVKLRVAFDIVEQYHDTAAAEKAAEAFDLKVRKKEIRAEDVPEVSLSDFVEGAETSVVDLCVKVKDAAGLNQSNSQLRRLIQQGGVSVDDASLTDPNAAVVVKSGMVVRLGKRAYYRVAVTS